MITEEALRAAGYREHKASNNYASRLFQKWIERDGIRLFALNFNEYEERPEIPFLPKSFVPEARLYPGRSNGAGFDLHNYEPFDSVEQVQAWFLFAYDRLGCVPDLHNQP